MYKKIVRKLEEKKMKKNPRGGAGGRTARGRYKQPHAILVLHTIFRVVLVDFEKCLKRLSL
jgi:hypothetical protein